MSLSSLIVQRGVATIREVEEALARQVLYGGDFVTNLFEVSRVEEAALMPLVAESFGFGAAAPGELPKPDAAAHRLVPVDVVQERVFAPLYAGETLIIAIAQPLSKEAEQELTFALALPIEQKIAPLFRIRQALARDYGIPIDKRIARLIQKVVTKGPSMASTYPPPLESVPNIRIPPRPPSLVPPPAPTPPNHSSRPSRPSATFLRSADIQMPRPKRRRGPLTLTVAIEELEASVERDVIFDILFEFARQFFDYTALFVVHGESAEGRDSFGDGAAREKVARLSVPLDASSILAAARREKTSLRIKPANDGLDAVLMADLGRDGTTECVVFPIVVRTRVVAIIVGDGGGTGVEEASVRNVESLIQSAGGAFERVIMRRKLKGDAAAREPEPPPPTQISNQELPEDRISVEELAAPIREIMMEPPSKRNVIRIDSEQPITPQVSRQEALTAPPPPSRRTRISGEMQQVVPPSVRPSVESTAPGRGPASSPPRRRGQAPPLEFGRIAEPRVTSESKRPEQLPVVQVHHAPGIHDAVTAPPPPTTPGDPWTSGASGTSEAPRSPKAASPPPMRVAPITDMSPQPMIIGPISEAIPDFSEAELASNIGSTTDRNPPVIEAPAPVVPPPSVAEPASARTIVGVPKFDEDEHPSLSKLVVQSLDDEPSSGKSLPVFDPDATPEAPQVSYLGPNEETPAAPLVTAPPPVRESIPADSTAEPVLSLLEKKKPVFKLKPMPPSEEQVSVGPHTPPSSHSDHSRVLPSVIVDVSSEYVGLVERVIATDDEEAETQLLRAGGYAMPAIMAKFPGPLTVEPDALDKEPLPRVADCGPVIRLIASQRRTALPFVLAHVEAPDAESRFWATYLLTELVYPDAIDAAVARAFDDEARVRRAARAAVRALAEAHPQPVVERLGEFTLAQTPELRIRAIEALAETRDASAVQVLLPLLEENSAEIAAATQKALVLITRHDFGVDTEKWTQWYDANKTRHRIEWLIDALNSDSRRLRGTSGEELKAITKESFGYYDDLPRRERERAQAKFREWWEAVGRVRFSRASTRGA